jgi:hypothetical protein
MIAVMGATGHTGKMTAELLSWSRAAPDRMRDEERQPGKQRRADTMTAMETR